jgi:hypothetical protein
MAPNHNTGSRAWKWANPALHHGEQLWLTCQPNSSGQARNGP